MKFGMIGAGTVSQRSRHVVKAGYEWFFSNSATANLGCFGRCIRPNASAGTVPKQGHGLVVLAVHWTQIRDAVRNLPARDAGSLLIPPTMLSVTPTMIADHLDVGAVNGRSLIPARMSSKV